MTIKKALIKTTLYKEGEPNEIPVFYSDELVGRSIYDLANSSVHGGRIPYLFAGYFSEDKKEGKWYFANARLHEEMRMAIEQETGKSMNYIYGQIHFNLPAMKSGKLRFDLLILHEDLPNKERAERQLREVISPEFLEADFIIVTPRR